MTQLVHTLSRLNRRILILLLAALVIIEGGLVWAMTLTLKPATATTDIVSTPLAEGPRITETPVSPTTLATATPRPDLDLQPVSREAGAAVASGDLTSVADSFDVEEALSYIEALTAPEFTGREAGSPGGQAAAEYIAEQFAQLGLQAAGTEGYYQSFSVPYAEVTAMPTLVITQTDGTLNDTFVLRQDYAWAWGGYCGGGEAEGHVFWLNAGAAEDYVGLDVVGQIVLCRSENSEEAARQALEHGASGLLLLTENQKRITMRRTYRESPYLSQSLPTLWVSSNVAAALVEGSGYALSDLTFLYRSLELATQVHMIVEMNEPGTSTAHNVLGVLPGADPELRDQVLILGAHYDHLGIDPDGTINAGANDDASGVGVLLEIARSWQAAGYTPERTVLFAAWDAEELGLFGSVAYVNNPSFPLNATVGMIQLDMVGVAVTGTLSLDSAVGRTDMSRVGLSSTDAVTWSSQSNALLEQLHTSAALYGVSTEDLGWGSGSDHVSFLDAGVPAAMLIWDAGEVPYYHTPADTVETLQLERLRETGLIVSHTAIALASITPRLEQVLADQVEAIRARDADALLATLDESDSTLLTATGDWLASRSEPLAQNYTLTVDQASVQAGSASAEVTVTSRDADDKAVTLATYPVQFVREGTTWRTTWPIAEVLTSTHLAVQIVDPDEGDEALAASMESVYAGLAPALGLLSTQPVTVTLYPNQSALEWLDLSSSAKARLGQAVVRSTSLTYTCVSLILTEMGLPAEQGEWLRTGLARWAEQTGDTGIQQASQYVPDIAADLSGAAVIAHADTLSDTAYTAAAWSMAQRFMDQYGVEGLRRLCAAWGATGSQEQAFAALGTPLNDFIASWEQAVPQALASARDGIAATLAERAEAVITRDRDAFLATLDAQNALYYAEETHWFDGLPAEIATYALSGELLTLEGDTALVRVSIQTQYDADTATQHTSVALRFRREGERWLLTDRDWQVRQTAHLAVYYTAEPTEFDAWLEAAERAYAHVSADLDYSPAQRVSIKLYESDYDLRASWPQDVPTWREDYTAEGEALKLVPTTVDSDAQLLARLLTQQALDERGLASDWLREGLATYEGTQAAPQQAGQNAAAYMADVREAFPFGKLYAWDAMPTYADVQEADLPLYRAQCWLWVKEFMRQFGTEKLGAWLTALTQGTEIEVAFTQATDISWVTWLDQWQQLAETGGVSDEWIATAQAFDVERTQADIERLASADLAGRRAGSAGGEAVAEWLAEQMRAIGLEPGASDGSYFQSVPVTTSELIDMPVLDVENSSTGESVSLEYLQSWGESVGGAAGGGECTSELVWLSGDYQEGMQLGGRIVLKRQEGEVPDEAAQALAHGAGGLVLVRQYYSAWQRETTATTTNVTNTLPVAIIGETSWETLVKLAGLTTYEANTAPPATLLPLKAHLAVPYSPAQASEAQNVIGILRGTDPDAPALILAAHYDGLGALPDGTYYPSANKNASGTAVLLEVARVLQSSGIQPRSSIYVIAWGAEELECASSQYYLLHPALAADQVLGVLNLDTVGTSRSYYLNLAGNETREGHLLSTLLLAGDLLDRRVTPGKADDTTSDTDESLRAAGYPTVLLLWPDADNLHTPLDTADTMEAHKLATTGEVAALASLLLAW